MKNAKILFLAALLGSVSITQTSCMGSFGLTNKVYGWNKSLGGKWVNELVFLVLLIVPVYEISFFIDGIILNSIEFWTGSNPVSMKAGDIEEQLVKGEDGTQYKITATQNQFAVEALSGNQKGTVEAMRFSPETNSWTLIKNNNEYEIATIQQRSQNGDIVFTTPFNNNTQVANIHELAAGAFAAK